MSYLHMLQWGSAPNKTIPLADNLFVNTYLRVCDDHLQRQNQPQLQHPCDGDRMHDRFTAGARAGAGCLLCTFVAYSQRMISIFCKYLQGCAVLLFVLLVIWNCRIGVFSIQSAAVDLFACWVSMCANCESEAVCFSWTNCIFIYKYDL